MSGDEPQIWCLLGRKAGDNTQVKALADALGYGYEEKQIQARGWELLVHLRNRGTLAGIDLKHSSVLAAPWPDLLITAGRRNEPVARWIQQQSAGRTRLVHIGRPWAPLDAYDLVVTTPQYFLPELANIRHNELPLHRLLPEKLSAAADAWRRSFGHMPRPWIAVLVGGDSGRFVFTGAKGKRLGQLANQLAAAEGGSLLVSDSPRTPPLVSSALESQLEVPNFTYHFSDGGNNPYLGLLALADAFVVTGESMSMLGEAAAMGKPLYIFDMGDGDKPWWQLPHNYRYKPLSHHLAMALGPGRMRRDVGRIQAALVESGRARWLDSESRLPAGWDDAASGSAGSASLDEGELEITARAVRQLLTPR